MWVYSKEGNFLVEYLVEPIRKILLTKVSRKNLSLLADFITFLMYFPIYSIYLLPLNFLPFFQYFKNFRKLSFVRNSMNVFDKLNAPQTKFISKSQAISWLPKDKFSDVSIVNYKGISWRICGVKL